MNIKHGEANNHLIKSLSVSDNEDESMGIRANYSDLVNRIILELEGTSSKLKKMGYKSHHILPREFYDYMTGETPTGDTITILDVLDNEFLMIHEVVEISELKKLGIPVDKQTVMMSHPKVYENHYKATEYELDYALSKENYDWLKIRINHAKSWLEDPNMPQHLIQRCKAIIKKYSAALKSSS